MRYSTSAVLQGETPDFYRSTPFEIETTAASTCASFVVTTVVTEPVGSWSVTARRAFSERQDKPEWEPQAL